MRAITLLALSLAIGIGASRQVEAGTILVDHVTDSANWSGVGGFQVQHDTVGRISVASAFIGNGEKITKVGIIFGITDGAGIPNAVSPEPLDWYVTFYEDFDAYGANPFSINDALSETKRFDLPSNPDFLTVIGQTGTLHLHYAEFDVSSEGWVTTPGINQAISILPHRGQMNLLKGFKTFFSYSNSTNAIGSESDWYRLWRDTVPTSELGPITLSELEAPHHKMAYKVETAR